MILREEYIVDECLNNLRKTTVDHHRINFLKNFSNLQKMQKNICQTFVIISIETPPSPKQFNIIGKVGHCLEKQHLSPVYFLRQNFIDNFKLNFLRYIIMLILYLSKNFLFLFCFLQVKCVEIFKCYVFCRDFFCN